METCPTVVWTEVGTAIITIGIGGEITVIVVVSLTGEEGSHRWTSPAGTYLRVALTQCWVVNYIVRKIGVECWYIVIFWFPALLSEHSCDTMFADSCRILQIVVQRPEVIAVLLQAALVTLTLPGSEVNHRVVGLSLGCTDIETQLAMPG